MLNRFKLLLIASLVWLSIFSLLYKINSNNNNNGQNGSLAAINSPRPKFRMDNAYVASWNFVQQQQQLKVSDLFSIKKIYLILEEVKTKRTNNHHYLKQLNLDFQFQVFRVSDSVCSNFVSTSAPKSI